MKVIDYVFPVYCFYSESCTNLRLTKEGILLLKINLLNVDSVFEMLVDKLSPRN